MYKRQAFVGEGEFHAVAGMGDAEDDFAATEGEPGVVRPRKAFPAAPEVGLFEEPGFAALEKAKGFSLGAAVGDDAVSYTHLDVYKRQEYTQVIELYGHVENVFDDKGNYVPRWRNTTKILGVPYDIPIPGYGTNTVNFLRLWESRPSEKINLEAFNRGGYNEALAAKTQSETVSKVLYPNDKTEAGKELRLIQQYFFVSCSLRDIIRRFRRTSPAWTDFPKKVAMQLNDTHPAIAVVELQRILHDEIELPWDCLLYTSRCV